MAVLTKHDCLNTCQEQTVVTDRFRATYFMSRHSGWCHKRTVEYVLQQSLDQVIEFPLLGTDFLSGGGIHAALRTVVWQPAA